MNEILEQMRKLNLADFRKILQFLKDKHPESYDILVKQIDKIAKSKISV